jgi:hypothetical protein
MISSYRTGAAWALLLGLGAVVTMALTWSARRQVGEAPADMASTLAGDSAELTRALVCGLGLTVVTFVGLQLVPVELSNPPPQEVAQWNSPETADLADRACANCHGNNTRWPWYAAMAPSSWLLSYHVVEARKIFNLSELNNLAPDRRSTLAQRMVRAINRGTMPPSDYLMLHPEARLTEAEKESLIQGLEASLPAAD